jgi:hypothetical protein
MRRTNQAVTTAVIMLLVTGVSQAQQPTGSPNLESAQRQSPNAGAQKKQPTTATDTAKANTQANRASERQVSDRCMRDLGTFGQSMRQQGYWLSG